MLCHTNGRLCLCNRALPDHVPSVLHHVPHPVPLQDLYERFLELVNGRPVGRDHAEVAMGRKLEMPRSGESVGRLVAGRAGPLVAQAGCGWRGLGRCWQWLGILCSCWPLNQRACLAYAWMGEAGQAGCVSEVVSRGIASGPALQAPYLLLSCLPFLPLLLLRCPSIIQLSPCRMRLCVRLCMFRRMRHHVHF
jgi:hypothetical protein